MGDQLDEEVGVHTQETNRGAGAPMLRGHIGPANLIVFDGVRINNGTFRTGPNQYLNLFDPWALDRIEVQRGAGGTLYGSDAIGGVIHLVPRRAGYGEDVRSRTLFGARSNDASVLVSPEISWSNSERMVQLGITAQSFSTLHTPNRTAVLGSEYEQVGWRFLAGRLLNGGHTDLQLSYFGTMLRDAGRIDRLYAGNFRSYDNDNHLLYVRVDHIGDGAFADVDFTVSLNAQDEGVTRHDCVRGDIYGLTDDAGDPLLTSADPVGCVAGDPTATSRRRENDDDTMTAGSSLVVRSELSDTGLELLWGGDAYQSFVLSGRTDFTPSDAPEGSDERGNFSDESRHGTYGVFARLSYDLELSDDMSLRPELGGRATHVRAAAPDVPGIGNVEYDFTGAAGSARLSLLWLETATLYAGWAQGFRVPNLQETTQLGDTGSFFEVPNPELGPERANEGEIGLRLRHDVISVEASGYYTAMSALIARQPAPFAGAPEIDGAEVRQRGNRDSGRFYGSELALRLGPIEDLTFRGNLSYTFGEVDTDDGVEPARRVPPVRWLLGVRYDFATWPVWAEVLATGAGAQTRLAPGDHDDLRICGSRAFPGLLVSDLGTECEGSKGWTQLSLRLGAELSDHVTLRLSLSNLSDHRYRPHGSGTDAAGFSAAGNAVVEF